MPAKISAIEYFVPERVLGNVELAAQYPEWTAERIEQKLGIVERHIAAEGECASDLGVQAAKKLFASGACAPGNVDYLLFCTQSPDYFLPTTACVLQARLGIPETAGALDFNLGCSGYVYGLGLAKGLIETGQSKTLLFITAETYSKFLHRDDKSVRTLFGDGATATLIEEAPSGPGGDIAGIGPFVMGTDGRGAEHLILTAGGFRKRIASQEVLIDANGNPKTDSCLYMNGGEIMAFTLEQVPKTVSDLLTKAHLALEGIDLFIFHQANKYLLDVLRKACGIAKDKFYVCFRHFGNTVSSSIPIALKDAVDAGRLRHGATAMLVGFGVGYSWGATIIRWHGISNGEVHPRSGVL